MSGGGSDGAFRAGEARGSGMDVECVRSGRAVCMGRSGRRKD